MEGLIRGSPTPDAARPTLDRRWPAGRAAIEMGAPGHVEDVRRNFIDLLSPAELDMFTALNERVLRHLATADGAPTGDEPS
jgi:hypothetical protein